MMSGSGPVVVVGLLEEEEQQQLDAHLKVPHKRKWK